MYYVAYVMFFYLLIWSDYQYKALEQAYCERCGTDGPSIADILQWLKARCVYCKNLAMEN